MSEHQKWLRQAADEIRKEGHYGWGNTCEQAADHIAELEQQLTELRVENERLARAWENLQKRASADKVIAMERQLAELREALRQANIRPNIRTRIGDHY